MNSDNPHFSQYLDNLQQVQPTESADGLSIEDLYSDEPLAQGLGGGFGATNQRVDPPNFPPPHNQGLSHHNDINNHNFSGPWDENGSYSHQNVPVDPAPIRIPALLPPSVYSGQPLYDVTPDISNVFDTRAPLNFNRQVQEQPPDSSIHFDNVYGPGSTVSGNNDQGQTASRSLAGSGRHPGKKAPKPQSKKLTQAPGSSYSSGQPILTTERVIASNTASGKRPSTESGTRAGKRPKSIAQPPQVSAAELRNRIHECFLETLNEGKYPLGMAFEQLSRLPSFAALLKPGDSNHITPEMVQGVHRILDYDIMSRTMELARHNFGIENPNDPNDLEAIRMRSDHIMITEFFMNGAINTALPNVVSHFITEREGLIHKYSKEGGEVELRPNEVEGFEHTTILHFANPAFAMVCQEILLLFPSELLELLRPGHGILSSVGAMLSTAFRRFRVGRLTWDPQFDILEPDEEPFEDVHYFFTKSQTLKKQTEDITTSLGGEKHSVTAILSDIVDKTKASAASKRSSGGNHLSPFYVASHRFGHFVMARSDQPAGAEAGPSTVV